jgi:hypothetical protein
MYRILEEFCSTNPEDKKFYIQRKTICQWKTIQLTENGLSEDLSFDSYQEAETHMYKNYFNRGLGGRISKLSTGIYTFIPYSYNTYM